jgi:GNAT superfamily N-acetyltransferase
MIIRKAQSGDEVAILELIKGLAAYENEPDAVVNTAEKLHDDLFKNNLCEAFVAETDTKIIGFALFYTSYSTWKGPCIYLEDLYVLPEERKSGAGTKLFDAVVDVAKERKVARMDWQVLDWNELAIKFYEKKNATIDTDWYNGRLFFEY